MKINLLVRHDSHKENAEVIVRLATQTSSTGISMQQAF